MAGSAHVCLPSARCRAGFYCHDFLPRFPAVVTLPECEYVPLRDLLATTFVPPASGAAPRLRLTPRSQVRTRLAAGGEWIRKFSSTMPRHRHQRGRLHSTVSGGSSSRRKSFYWSAEADDCSDDIDARRVDRPQLGRSLEPLLISGGTGSPNPLPSSGDSCANHWLAATFALRSATSSTAFFSPRSPAFVGL